MLKFSKWLPGHTDSTALTFSPDGRLLARASDEKVILWDVAEGKERAALDGFKGSALAFSPDGQTLVFGKRLGAISCWDLAGARERLVIPAHEGTTVNTLSFSSDGSLLASAGEDRSVKLWDPATGRLRVLLPRSKLGFKTDHAIFVPNSRTVVTNCEDSPHHSGIRLWDTQQNAARPVLRGPRGYVTFARFSPDGNTLVTGSGDEPLAHDVVWPFRAKDVVLWDVPQQKVRATLSLKGEISGVESLAFAPDSQTFATARPQDVSLWKTDTGERKVTFKQTWASSLAFSPDGRILASGGHERDKQASRGTTGTLKLWDMASGKELVALEGHAEDVHALAFSPDGKVLASGSRDGTTRLWETATGKELKILQREKLWIKSLAFTPNGATLVTTTGPPSAVKLWDVAGRQLRAELKPEKGDIFTCVSVSRAGDVLAAGTSTDGNKTGKPGQVKLWATATGKLLATCKGHTRGVYAVAISPDGKTLASAGWDNTVRLWDVVTGRERLALKGHDGQVSCLAFSPNGDSLVSGGEDGTVRFWLTATEAEMRGFKK